MLARNWISPRKVDVGVDPRAAPRDIKLKRTAVSGAIML